MGGLLAAMPRALRDKLAVHMGRPDIRFSLSQLKRYGFAPGQVVDVGAYRGEWARSCLDVWPEARVLCIEPQQAVQPELDQLVREKAPRVAVVRCMAGASDAERVDFFEHGSGTSVLAGGPATCASPMRRIDTLVDSGACRAPELVKIDVQGYELEVLAGFDRHFPSCEVLQIELSLLPIVRGAPLLHEAVAHLATRGFVMFDVDELIRAPSDAAVWQIDALFCREHSVLRSRRAWR